MQTMPIMKYGQPDQMELNWGIDILTGQKIAAIIAFSGGIEFFLERAIWKLQGFDPDGKKPGTDGRPIKKLIDMFEDCVSALPISYESTLVSTWCEAARAGFTIRNNIVHGVPSKIGGIAVFLRNPRWNGEHRGREFGDFWANHNTLDLVRASFSVLLRVVAEIVVKEKSLTEIATKEVFVALNQARSVLGEFSARVEVP